RVGTGEATVTLEVAGHEGTCEPATAKDPSAAAEQVIRRLLALPAGPDQRPLAIDAVGCRVVHGGARFVEPARVTPAVLEEIRSLSRLAPLHNPVDAAVLEASLRLLPDLPVVAVFDTAFHQTLPDVAATYALPLDL